MYRKPNSTLLYIIAMLLLCCLVLTGKCLTSKNSATETATAHQNANGRCTICGDTDPSYQESASSMVWIPTNGGTKYHSHSGCSNMKNPQEVLLSKAKQLGFTPCKRCYG